MHWLGLHVFIGIGASSASYWGDAFATGFRGVNPEDKDI